MIYPRNSPLSDDLTARLLGLEDLRIGRHSFRCEELLEDQDFWVQSIWRARVLPSSDADAFLVVVTCADPSQPEATPRLGFWARCKKLFGVRPKLPNICWRKAILSLQGRITKIDLPDDPVAGVLREIDLFETHRYQSLDGIGYSLDVETYSLRACIAFSNPEVPSLKRLAKALLAVGQEVARVSGDDSVADYLKIWSRYES